MSVVEKVRPLESFASVLNSW